MLRKMILVVTVLAVFFSCQSAFANGMLKMVPEKADFILNLNVSKILSMPEVKNQIKESFEKDPNQKKTYEELKSKSGFDPLNDLHNIVIFSSGEVAEGKEPLAGAVIQGKFDAEKIVKLIKEDESAAKDVEVKKIDGFNAIVPKNSKDGYGLFLDNSYVTVGSQSGVDAVKAVKTKKAKSVEAKKDFFAILSKLDSKATLSGAGLLPESFKKKCAQNPNAAALANLNFFRFDFNNDSNMVLNFNAEVDKKENVEKVMTQVNGYVAMIKMFASQSPEAAEIVGMLSVSSEGTSIKLSLNIPAEKIKEIKAKIEAKAKQGMGGADSPRE